LQNNKLYKEGPKMLTKLEKVIQDLSSRMRQLKAAQFENPANITERDEMILNLLAENGPMAVSKIAKADHQASFSTISMNISKLWRNKFVSKSVSPKNQRITMVELTEKGKKMTNLLEAQKAQRAKILLQALNLTDSETQILLGILTRAIPYFDNPMLGKELHEIQTESRY
jgi:DNA-binding MarR family transcriptional regulator